MGREYPDRPIVGVGAVILVSPREARDIGAPAPSTQHGVILVKRKFQPLAGQWSLPGGAVDVGETLEQAIVREVAEETGLTIEVDRVVDVFDRIFLDADGRVQYHYVLIDYVCHPTGGRLCAGSDVSDAIVADRRDLTSYALTAKTLDVIHKSLEP